MDLIQLLINNLGVQESQAKGGAGLLFEFAQKQLSSGEFSQIAEVVPNIEGLINSAPKSGGLLGALGGLVSTFGGSKADDLGDLASLVGGFSKLNLDSSMVTQFVPVILSYVQGQGGDGIMGILEKVLKVNN